VPQSRTQRFIARHQPDEVVADSRAFEVVLTPEEEGGYSVSVPGLPGRFSQGETCEEALAMIREAIELYIESLDAHATRFRARSRSSASPSTCDVSAAGGNATQSSSSA
jgi:predicted RNase H-like HicB family nuclease